MKHFRLPDLGEGLAEAEILEWMVQDGQTVCAHETLLAVETAKAVVEVPSPVAGVVKKRFGQVGDVISIGSVLVEFEQGEADQGSVVGQMVQQQQSIRDDFIIGVVDADHLNVAQMTPQARTLAQRLNVDTPDVGKIWSEQDVIDAYVRLGQGREQMKGSRKNMAQWMSSTAAREVVPASLSDDVVCQGNIDLSQLIVRVMQAMALACLEETALNAWFDGLSYTRQLHESVHIGVAVDSEYGLYVPVITDVANKSLQQLRAEVNEAVNLVRKRQMPANRQEATITLSNFGAIGGRYATPVITAPQVAILGVGRVFNSLQLVENDQVKNQPTIPLSLTFDHRACTGGEAARFLQLIGDKLAKPW